MPHPRLLEMPQAQRERVFHIEFRLYFLGTVHRSDLIERFGIKEAAASRDLAEYRKIRPDNMVFDTKSKAYFKGDCFDPLFEYTPKQVLSALSQGMGAHFAGMHTSMIACETPVLLNHPSVEVLSALSTAIHQGQAVHIEYCSLSSGTSEREIVPLALVDNGLRWHVRAYDRKRNRFADFVLTRITNAVVRFGHVERHEKKDADIQWNRIVEMEIVPHPNEKNVEHPNAVELDYGMKDGVLKVNIRAAVAGYVLRRWNVDCSPDHSRKGKEYQLWLRNTPALYGVENLSIAPGYGSEA
ncbi:WYL domain-containing protein [Gallaecimonas sp. GXIMD4217]|uniref:helix-turn-helix transcriptional regulator n=1 Tax=Gallaecimonas sp. GXIMD4217 TaxID=3131927 RepID=UPI00311B2DF7